MAIVTEQKTGVVAGTSVVTYYRYQDSVSSPRDASGKLVLVMNPYELRVGKMGPWSSAGSNPQVLQHYGVNQSLHNRHKDYYPAVAAINNELNGKMYGKLHYQGGSLGVSLATWTQSSNMIKGRFAKPVKFLGNMLGVIKSAKQSGMKIPQLARPDPSMKDLSRFLDRIETRLPARLKPKTGPGAPGQTRLADYILEYEFGWKPLIEDFKTALSNFTHAIPDEYIRVSAKRSLSETVGNFVPSGTENDRSNGVYVKMCQVRGSYVVQVQVSNPNLWLANYLGLINLPGIAWDLVPWSFVVNMFTNAGSLVNSLTYDVGLSLTGHSNTIASQALLTAVGKSGYFQSSYGCTWTERQVKRTVGKPPPRSLIFRWPKPDFELGLIGGALITQQIQRVIRKF